MMRRSTRVRLALFATLAVFSVGSFAPARTSADGTGDRGATATAPAILRHVSEPVSAPLYEDGRIIVRYREEPSGSAAKRSEERAGVRAIVGATVRRSYSELADI